MYRDHLAQNQVVAVALPAPVLVERPGINLASRPVPHLFCGWNVSANVMRVALEKSEARSKRIDLIRL